MLNAQNVKSKFKLEVKKKTCLNKFKINFFEIKNNMMTLNNTKYPNQKAHTLE